MEEPAPTDLVTSEVEDASHDSSHSDSDSSGNSSDSDSSAPRMHKLQQEQDRSMAMARHIAEHLQSLMCLTVRFAALQKDGGDLNDDMVVNSRSVEVDEENSHELGRLSDFASEADVVRMKDVDNANSDDSLNPDGGLLPDDVPVPATEFDLSHIPRQHDNLSTEDDAFLQQVLKSGAFTNESLWESVPDIIQQDTSKPLSTKEPSKSDRDTYGSPLLWATAIGYTFVFQRLLEKGANPDMKATHRGWASLHVAVMYKQDLFAEMLLRTGATVDIKDKQGQTALMYASSHSRVDMLQVLLSHGANVNLTSDDGSTALIIAVRNWDSAMVNGLIDGGADFTLSMEDGWTPLMYGSRDGLDEIVEEFLAQGAHVDGGNGPTPLILASAGGHQRVVEKLLEHGANVNARDPDDGTTALSHAAAGGHYRVAEMLIQEGADINARDDKDGFTPLMHAAAGEEAEIARLLVEVGADIAIKDRGGERDARSLALDNGDEYLGSILGHKHARTRY